MESFWVGEQGKAGESGALGEGMEAPRSFPLSSPYLSYLAIPRIISFFNKPVIS